MSIRGLHFSGQLTCFVTGCSPYLLVTNIAEQPCWALIDIKPSYCLLLETRHLAGIPQGFPARNSCDRAVHMLS